MKKRWNKTAGFTLVELIVVIAILGILAGVAVPVYSGYVKKANLAADQTLLNSVNTAFAAACIENQVDINTVASATLVIDDATKTVDVDASTLVNDDVKADFGTYFGADSSTKFKVVKDGDINFNPTTHMFEITNLGVYANLLGTFNELDIDAFKNSVFSERNFDSLMGQVDMATQVAVDANPTSALGQMVYGQDAMDSLTLYLGNGDVEDGQEALLRLFDERAALIGDPSDPAVQAQAQKEIFANYAVLNAATNSNYESAEFVAFKQGLAAGQGRDAINGTGTQAELAQTAMAYAMYTSYVSRYHSDTPPSNNPSEVLATLKTQEFVDYMNDPNGYAEKDMQGYLSAMNMIKDASGDTEAGSTLLVNGFTDPALIALLKQEIGD